MIRVLIADDSPNIRDCLSSLIGAQSDFLVVGIAEDGLEAVEKAKDLQPDVVISDNGRSDAPDGWHRGYQENKTRLPCHQHFVPEHVHRQH